jgi:hypothetical protein
MPEHRSITRPASSIDREVERHVERCEERTSRTVDMVRAFVPVSINEFLVIFGQVVLLKTLYGGRVRLGLGSGELGH